MVTGLLALLDDLTLIVDDVAALTKVAAKKTAGIATDDLAVNAEAMVGFQPSRELPILFKVFLGSLFNKAWIIPLALLLPSKIVGPLLMCGGAFLCYEGLHKVIDYFSKRDAAGEAHDEAHKTELRQAVIAGPEALAAIERDKVKGAIITDLVLSAEIVAIALGAVADEPLKTKAIVLALIGVAMTIGIYGIVAFLVKLDDIGLLLVRSHGAGLRASLGAFIVKDMPTLMKGIAVVGTIAMFLVGGGIIIHGIPKLEPWIDGAIAALALPGPLSTLLDALSSLAAGVIAGAVVIGVLTAGQALLRRVRGGT